MTTFESDSNKSKMVYIRVQPELEQDYQALRRIYPGNRSDIMRFALQKFADAHREELDRLEAQQQ